MKNIKDLEEYGEFIKTNKKKERKEIVLRIRKEEEMSSDNYKGLLKKAMLYVDKILEPRMKSERELYEEEQRRIRNRETLISYGHMVKGRVYR